MCVSTELKLALPGSSKSGLSASPLPCHQGPGAGLGAPVLSARASNGSLRAPRASRPCRRSSADMCGVHRLGQTS